MVYNMKTFIPEKIQVPIILGVQIAGSDSGKIFNIF